MDTARVYFDSDDNECTIYQMVQRYPDWAASRIQEGEKALVRIAELEDRNDTLHRKNIKLSADIMNAGVHLESVCACYETKLKDCGRKLLEAQSDALNTALEVDRLKAQLKTAKRDGILDAVRLTRTSYTEGGSEWLCPVNDLINYANAL